MIASLPSAPSASMQQHVSNPGQEQNDKEPITTLPDGRPLIDNTGRPIKRKRPQSCDYCRTRKTKCVRPEAEGLEQGDLRCVQCRTAGVPCTWDYVPKRPGPQTHLNVGTSAVASASGASHSAIGTTKKQKKQLSQEEAHQVAQSSPPVIGMRNLSTAGGSSSRPPSPRSEDGSRGGNQYVGSGGGVNNVLGGFSEAAQMSAHFENPPPNPFQPFNYGLRPQEMEMGPSAGNLSQPYHSQDFIPVVPLTGPSWHPATGHSPTAHYEQDQHGGRQQSGTYLQPTPPRNHPEYHSAEPRSAGHRPEGPSISPRVPDGAARCSSSTSGSVAGQGQKPRFKQLGKVYAAPIDRPRSLDDVAPRATFLSIISLYFHHLWPLMPIVHQPTFSFDLLTRRDERDSDFLCFVLSLTAYALIQCPRSVIPAPWPFYRKLHQICHLTVRRMQLDRHTTADPPSLTQCATLYTTHIYMGSTGRTFAANAIHGELVRTAFSINLHDETRPLPSATGLPHASQGPPQLSEIERQLRRRVYYLIYGSDKTISILSDEPISLRDADTVGVEIPVAVDDDMIMHHSINPQPSERGPSVLCGFEAVSKLHHVMSELVESFRYDRRCPPPTIEATQRRLEFANSLLRKIQAIVAQMPEVLQRPSFEHTEPPRRPSGELPDLGRPYFQRGGGGGPGGSTSFGSAGVSVGGGGGPTKSHMGVGAQPHHQQQQQQSTQPRSSQPQPGLLPLAPWPNGTFDEHGLPVMYVDNHSQPSSSAPSPSTGTAGWTSKMAGQTQPRGRGSFDGSAHVPLGAQYGNSTTGFMGGAQGTGSPTLPAMSQLYAARNQVTAFHPAPPASDPSRPPILSGFAICRANILVTEAMLRFVLVDYQEYLQGVLAQHRLSEGRGSKQHDSYGGGEGLLDGGSSSSTTGGSSGPCQSGNDIEEAAQSFFAEAVASLPFDALAANGQSLILKLIFIISGLLNRTNSTSRAYSFMTEFLATLTKLSERRTEGDQEPEPEEEDEGESNETAKRMLPWMVRFRGQQ